MKKKHLLGLLLMAMVIGIGFTSCKKDNTDNSGIEMRMRNYDNGRDRITLLRVDSTWFGSEYYGYGESWHNAVLSLFITSSNNFTVKESDDNWLMNFDCSIACSGNVNSLSKIKNIPNSGWTSEVAVHPGQGYVIRHKNDVDNAKKFCRYARVYVEDWIEGTNGGIIGAVIRYQDNWKIEE